MSFADRFASRRAMFAPSPMIRPRSAAFSSGARVRARGDEQQLVDGRRRRVGVLAVDRLRLEAALDDAARDELGRRRDAAVDARERVEPDGQGVRVAADQPPDPGRADLADRLAVELVGRAGRHGHDALRRAARRRRPARC